MARVIIPAGKWYFAEDSAGVRERLPMIECPACGLPLLGGNAPHGIRRNGDVFQSVVCGRNGCAFHEFVTLAGWSGGSIEHA